MPSLRGEHPVHIAGVTGSSPVSPTKDFKYLEASNTALLGTCVPASRIFIAELGRPGRYQARQDSPQGPVLVASTRQPLLDGCRALLAKGITGPVEMWDAVRPYPRMRADIEKAAKLTIEETAAAGLRVRPWRPFLRGTGTPEMASDGPELPEEG
jgi:hypothetical protein